MKKVVAMLFCLLALAGAVSAQQKFVTIATASAGTAGTYFPLGGALAEIWNKNIPKMNANATATGAIPPPTSPCSPRARSMSSSRRTISPTYALNDLEIMKGKGTKNIRGLACLYNETVQVVAHRRFRHQVRFGPQGQEGRRRRGWIGHGPQRPAGPRGRRHLLQRHQGPVSVLRRVRVQPQGRQTIDVRVQRRRRPDRSHPGPRRLQEDPDRRHRRRCGEEAHDQVLLLHDAEAPRRHLYRPDQRRQHGRRQVHARGQLQARRQPRLRPSQDHVRERRAPRRLPQDGRQHQDRQRAGRHVHSPCIPVPRSSTKRTSNCDLRTG